MELKEGMYARVRGIDEAKIVKIKKFDEDGLGFKGDDNNYYLNLFVLNASFNLIDLIEYMDLLEIENHVKLYGRDREVSLFNPVRCDGFTEFENGTHCIILDLDYLVNVKDLKIKSIVTKEQFDSMKYVVERGK